jgi:hypothetical protein
MATVLSKDLVRETTEKRKDKEIVVTLTKDQEINLKLKGVRGSKGVNINIGELWDYLNDNDYTPKEGSNDNPMLSLYELRAAMAIADVPYNVTMSNDKTMVRLIEMKKNG